jgi:4-amino-4-deoxy-L-arabinose transferase-like glycosyltransferase
MPYRHLALVIAALLVAASYIASTYPRSDQYRPGADEGTYYRQGREIREHGAAGYGVLAERFIQDRDAHIFPPPLRVLPLALNALALSVYDSYGSLSTLSLICFMVLGLVSYYYLKEVWDPDLAVIAVVLLAFSPLGCAMARRALIDSLTYLVTAFSLLSFLAVAVRRNTGSIVVFSVSLFLLQLTRETGFLLYPFYFGVLLFLHYRRPSEIGLRAVLLCFLVPVCAMTVVYLSLYGIGPLFRMGEMIYSDNLMKPSYYVVSFSSGPWYRYLVDFMLLSPLTMLPAYLYAGHWLLRKQYDARTGILLGFFAYTIMVFSFLQMNVRYVIALDLVIRILAALAVVAFSSVVLADWRKRSIMIAVVIIILAITDIRAFTDYFVTNNVYDPVSYNLLSVERFIPAPPPHY